MNGFSLMIPLFIVRFLILQVLNSEAVKKAAHFAPLESNEKIAYYVYQLTSISLVSLPFFTIVKFNSIFSYVGIISYVFGIVLLLLSTIHFALPKDCELKTHGIYRVSRNPMYVGYFFYFLGCVILTESLLLFVSLIFFQVSAHWIILGEERWCQRKFGVRYLAYQTKVRRYF